MALIDGLAPFLLQQGRDQDQEALGSTLAGGALVLGSTTSPVKGLIHWGTLVYDEPHGRFGNVPQPEASLHVAGRIKLGNLADARTTALAIDSPAGAPSGSPVGSLLLIGAGARYLVPVYGLSVSQAAAASVGQRLTARFRWQVAAAGG